MKKAILFFAFFLLCLSAKAQQSVAREWNELILLSIRNDFARPTVHARNLFHTSVAMYDAWAIFEPGADTYFLGKTVSGYECPLNCVPTAQNTRAAQEEAMSYATYRLIKQRFQNAPFSAFISRKADELMEEMGYDISNESILVSDGAAELGNFLAFHLIQFGLSDGSNEQNDYANVFYEPVNSPIQIAAPGNSILTDFDRWQPIQFSNFVDQSGNPLGSVTPDFLSPEWGSVFPFALEEKDLTIEERNGNDYWVYHDPGPPPYINKEDSIALEDEYKWGHTLVGVWSSHLDPSDSVIWDISPGAKGNIQNYPQNIAELRDFYDLFEGGDTGKGHNINPKTGQPYPPNLVSRADYARVLAEFWADGPDSETPPGHWFTILNYVNDHPDLVRKIGGEGDELGQLEWDVKTYFALGGAMHDAAISAWGIKGWYDYIRPVSAIRGMGTKGQSSESGLPNYHPAGLPLIPGFIEMITADDSLSGMFDQNVNKLKIWAWEGPSKISNPRLDVAGVGWIVVDDWLPYQRPTFVTPPFAGYVSGHSTFSRAAAEVLTGLTGDPFFPGGVGEFFCSKNQFLVFEDGPSENITLQWATYRDASDQCSLSRIWGGIHPPADDIPGRLIGEKIGVAALEFATKYFELETPPNSDFELKIFPNPTSCGAIVQDNHTGEMKYRLFQSDGKLVRDGILNFFDFRATVDLSELATGVYILVGGNGDEPNFKQKIVKF